jgi:hypothetical protein
LTQIKRLSFKKSHKLRLIAKIR